MMHTTTGIAEVNGTRLYYEMAGAGDPVVLVHGFSLNTRMWDDQAACLSSSRTVVRYDLRGFGRSALPGGEGYTHADDLQALMDYLGLARASLIGLSLGAAVALDFTLDNPGRAGALVLADPVLRGYVWSPEQSALDGGVWETAARHGIAAAKAQWLGHPLFAPARANPRAAAHLSQIVSEYAGWHFVNNDPHRYAGPPASQRLGEVGAPTLIVIGERDLPDFRAIAVTLAGTIRGAQFLEIPGAGHMSNMEAPEQFNQAVLDFLDQSVDRPIRAEEAVQE
jgi:3-oxoadipate enol-lactonase